MDEMFIKGKMKKDRSNWTVRKVSFAEAEDLDDQYYASLSETERLEIVMNLRSMIDSGSDKIIPVFRKRHLHEQDEI